MRKNIIISVLVILLLMIAGFIFFSNKTVAPTVPTSENIETPVFADKSDKIFVTNIV